MRPVPDVLIEKKQRKTVYLTKGLPETQSFVTMDSHTTVTDQPHKMYPPLSSDVHDDS